MTAAERRAMESLDILDRLRAAQWIGRRRKAVLLLGGASTGILGRLIDDAYGEIFRLRAERRAGNKEGARR